jgi:thioredoxin 2
VPSTVECPSCGTRNRLAPSPTGRPRCRSCKAPLPWIVDAGPGEFASEVDAALPVVVDLWAPWCGPCRTVGPALERIARERAGSVKLVKVDVDRAPDVAARFDARSIPTLLVMRRGEVVDRVVGALPPPELARWIDGHLAPPA